MAVPALVYVAGQAPKAATTTSLLVVGASALAGAFGHWRAGRVRLGAGVVFGLTGIGGSLVGTSLNRSINPNLLLLGFAGLMLIAAWRMTVGQRTKKTSPADTAEIPNTAETSAGTVTSPHQLSTATMMPRSSRSTEVITPERLRRWTRTLVAGTFVGLLTGFFGVGGGFVIVPVLLLVLDMEMPVAVGTSLIVIGINSAVSLIARAGTGGGLDLHVALPFTIAALLGASAGTKAAHRLPVNTLVKWFVGLLILVAIYTATRSAFALFGL